MSTEPDFDPDNEDDAKESANEMFAVKGVPNKPPAPGSMEDSMKALFGSVGAPAGVKIISSSQTKNKYAVVAKKGNRELALCSSLTLVKGGGAPFFALKVRLLDIYDNDADSVENTFGLRLQDDGKYNTDAGVVYFKRANPVMIPLLEVPASPSEVGTYLIEREVGSIVGESIKALVAKAGGEMVVPDGTLYELVVVDANNLPTKPKGLFDATKLGVAFGTKPPAPKVEDPDGSGDEAEGNE